MTRIPGPGRPGTAIFPPEALAEARFIALLDDVTILKSEWISDEAGSGEDKWTEGETVKGRLDAAGGSGRGLTGAALIDEESTHTVHLEPTANVDASDRLRIGGRDFIITTQRRYTKQASIALEVKAI
jgi:hypothetical protein